MTINQTHQNNQKTELMERASAIHIYCNTPSHVWPGRQVNTCSRKRATTHEPHVWHNRYMDTKREGGGYQQFLINCEARTQTRDLMLWPCQASCTSQRNQKSKVMEKASVIHIYCNKAYNTFVRTRNDITYIIEQSSIYLKVKFQKWKK